MVLQRLGAAFIVFVALAACSGDDDETASAEAPATTTTAVATTTTAAPTTSTVPTPPTTPPPYSFDGSVPAPPLINTGNDYAAIFESLDAYGGWLLAHNPDDAVGTRGIRARHVRLRTPAETRSRHASRTTCGSSMCVTRPRSTVVDVALPIVSLRVVESGERSRHSRAMGTSRRGGRHQSDMARHPSGRREQEGSAFRALIQPMSDGSRRAMRARRCHCHRSRGARLSTTPARAATRRRRVGRLEEGAVRRSSCGSATTSLRPALPTPQPPPTREKPSTVLLGGGAAFFYWGWARASLQRIGHGRRGRVRLVVHDLQAQPRYRRDRRRANLAVCAVPA